MGAHEPGNRLEVVMPDRPGTLAGVAGIFGELGINIVSAVAGPRRDLPDSSEPGRVAVFRVDTMDLRGAVEILELEAYGFGGDHPFNPLRIRLTLELCEALGLLQDYPFVVPEPATVEDLTTVHSLTYVRLVQKAGRGLGALSDLIHYGLGTGDNPIFPDMHEACARVVGAVLQACRMVMRGETEHAMCVSGGLHHAMRTRASGFCVYNDASVAIARLKEEHPG